MHSVLLDGKRRMRPKRDKLEMNKKANRPTSKRSNLMLTLLTQELSKNI